MATARLQSRIPGLLLRGSLRASWSLVEVASEAEADDEDGEEEGDETEERPGSQLIESVISGGPGRGGI